MPAWHLQWLLLQLPVAVVVVAEAEADAATSSCNQCNLVASHVRNVVHRSTAS